MAAEVPLPSTSPRRPVSVPQVRRRAHQAWTHQPRLPGFGGSASVSQLQPPKLGAPARPRAHQAPFYARGLQKIGAVSENAPGAHGIVPRHCSTRAAGMNTVSAARPPPRNLHREVPAAAASATKPPQRSPCRGAAPTAPPPPQRESGKFSRSRLCREVPAATASTANPRREPPPRSPRRAPPLPRREEQQGQTGEQHREVHSLVFDVIFLEEQRSEDESDHDAAAPYHRDDREQRPLILDRVEIECV